MKQVIIPLLLLFSFFSLDTRADLSSPKDVTVSLIASSDAGQAVVSAGAGAALKFEDVDPDSTHPDSYNTTTGEFTAPMVGDYDVKVNVQPSGAAAAWDWYIRVGGTIVHAKKFRNHTTFDSKDIQFTVHLEAGEVLRIDADIDTDTTLSTTAYYNTLSIVKR